MNNQELSYLHPSIISKHDLDVADFENFAIELSIKLQLNIEMKYHRSSLETDNIIKFNDTVEKANLFEMYQSFIPENKFNLELDKVILVFYEDFIEFNFGFTLDYFHLFQLHQENKLKSILYFRNLFNQLKSLGINEIYLSVFKEFNMPSNSVYKWENVLNVVTSNENYFILEI
jgi:hypothetical protein